MLFKRNELPAQPEPVQPLRAKAIYGRLRTGQTESDLFREANDPVPFHHSSIVMAEAREIESMMNQLMGVAQDDGQMANLTEETIVASISSTLLDVAQVVADVRQWSDGNPDQAPSWENYKATFNQE